MKIRVIISMLIIGICFFSCRNNSNGTNKSINKDSIAKPVKKDTTIVKNGELPIFYNMYLTVEMTSLFKSIGASYNYKIINSPNKVDTYITSTSQALNLGVYAVDLCYCKYFEQFEQASRYLQNMHKLSNEMGIPDEKFYLSVKRVENNLSIKDSLIKIANELYATADKFLKQDERESSAALIIVGGWIETMFVATNLVKKDEPDVVLLERIEEQKSSLKNLINLVNKYPKDKIAQEYCKQLIELQNIYNDFSVNEKYLQPSLKQLQEITEKISKIRMSIVG